MQIRIGGDPESYMDPPQLGVGGGGGGGSFIAGILDALGIHKQVAKGAGQKDLATDSKKIQPKKQEAPANSKDSKGNESQSQAAPKSDILSSVETAVSPLPMVNQSFVPILPAVSRMRSADRVTPLIQIDPDSVFPR